MREDRSLSLFGIVEVELQVPKEKRMWDSFLFPAHHLRAWTKEQAGRSGRGMLCVEQGESEDGSPQLNSSPGPGKVCPVARRNNQNVTQRSVIWVGQPPPGQPGMLQRYQAAMLFPGARGPLGLSFPPRGEGQESEQPHGAPGEHPGVDPLHLESSGIIYKETLARHLACSELSVPWFHYYGETWKRTF